MLEKIKTLCCITDNSCDADINKFINIYANTLRKTLKEQFIFNPVTSSLIDTGICEIIAGQFINSLNRKNNPGKISLSSFTYEETNLKGDDLIKSGYDKLAPFTKDYNEKSIFCFSPKEVF